MQSFRRRMRWLFRLCSIRTLCVAITCCVLFELSRGYSLDQRLLDKKNDVKRQSEMERRAEHETLNNGHTNGRNDNLEGIQHPPVKKIPAKSANLEGDDFDGKLGNPAVAPIPKAKHQEFPKDDEIPNDVIREKEKKSADYEVGVQPGPVKNAGAIVQSQVSNTKAQPLSSKESFYTNRIIHFDLKGAAPKVDYLKKVMQLVQQNGATGVMIEWEDTFPWSGPLLENRNTDAYTMGEVREILDSARSLGLEVIPLVQTFGHLEWILKLEKYRKHRENDNFPQVVCLADDEGVSLVKEALKQVIEVHKEYGINYFHIGADEAFEFGVCAKDIEFYKAHPTNGRDILAPQHFKKIADYVHSFVPNARILAWHDMLKNFLPPIVKELGLAELIEPVVWDYSETVQQQNEYTWRQLSQTFRTVWGSSSYKGANNPSEQYLDIQHYMKNNQAWVDHKSQFGKYFDTFRGLILTGWQRYDHFAVLCEILPTGLPSAIVNLQIAQAGVNRDAGQLVTKVSQALHCNFPVSLDASASFGRCSFPGSEVYTLIHISLPQQLEVINREVYMNHHFKGWVGRMNVHHNYSQRWYLDGLENTLSMYLSGFLQFEQKLRKAMEPIFNQNAIDEWVFEYLDPTSEKLTEDLKNIRQLRQAKTFPTRNFKIRRTIGAPNPVAA